MSKKIATMLWFVGGMALPITIAIMLYAYIYVSQTIHIVPSVALFVIAFLHFILPALCITMIYIKKLCSLISVSIGYIVSVFIYYALVPADNRGFFPNLERNVYTLFAYLFIAVTVILAIIDLVLQKRKRNKHLKQSHCYDTMEHTASKGVYFAKRAYNYVRKIFTDD